MGPRHRRQYTVATCKVSNGWSCPGNVDTYMLERKGFTMPRTHPAYPPEYRRQLVELVRAGSSPGKLAKEFDLAVGSIRAWVKQADLDQGRRHDGLTTDERQELARLRRENQRLGLGRGD